MSWTAPAFNGGKPITGYVVTPYINGVAQTATPFNSTATTQTVGGLVNGTTYTFTVAAINEIGTGPQSAQSNETHASRRAGRAHRRHGGAGQR